MIKDLLKPTYRFARSGVHRVRDAILRPEAIYRAYLKTSCGVNFPPAQMPRQSSVQGALKSRRDWQSSWDQAGALHLPRHPDKPKSWDTLAALSQVLAETTPEARIFDAGAEIYSSFLPSLYAYGYRNLFGINLVFSRPINRGPIRYEPGDITATRFPDHFFHAAACLSVVEHGVNLPAFFKEMSRVIKPYGLLVVSTDYWEAPLDTGDKHAYGTPIHVFSRPEIEAAIQAAQAVGLELAAPIDLACDEQAVGWDYYGLRYTYVLLTFRNTQNASTKTPSADVVPVLTTI